MKQLQADMKKGIYKKIYLLTGTQDYMKKRAARSLSSVFVASDDTMNLASFHGKKTDIKEIIALADTMPFLAEKRVIILEDTEFFSHSCEELADYIPVMPDSTMLIFCEEKADSRLKHTKLVAKEGCIADFSDLSEKELRDWVKSKLAREHRPITEKALDLFMMRCGSDMWEVSNELEKLISYTFKKEGIRIEDIDAVLPATAQDKVFDMIDAMLSGRVQAVLKYYTDLCALRSDPMGILKLLRDQFRLYLHVKELDRDRMRTDKMATLLGMREGRVKMALPVSRKSSTISLTEKIEMCAETEQRIKSGLIDQQIGVETMIVEMTEKAGGT
jgi:DNA polymerase-3 subunit delta